MFKNFYSITLADEYETVKITPNNLYVITNKLPPNIIVMYEIEHYQNSDLINPKMISRIPYYISDGQTNNLRANMLYPFGCFSMYGSKHCPYDIYKPESNGLLLKYVFLKNVNAKKLELELIKYFFERGYPQTSKFESAISIPASQDLNSVIPRLGNLLDFTICIINDIFINFNYIEEDKLINQGKYSPFNNEQAKMDLDYTDMEIFGLGSKFLKKDVDNFNNNFRSVLLTIFHIYSNLFISTNMIQLNKISLQPNLINTDTFNIITQVCNKEYASTNMFNYIEISNQFKNLFLNRINILQLNVEQNEMLKAIIDISEHTPFTRETAYSKFRTTFGVRCIEFKEGYIPEIPETYDIDEITIDQLLHKIDLLDIKFKTYERYKRWRGDYTKEKLNEIEKDKLDEEDYKYELIKLIKDLCVKINTENIMI